MFGVVPSALVAAELARHLGLEIELNLLHIAPSVPRPLLYKYPLIHAHISKLRTSIYDIHDLTRTCNSRIPSHKKIKPINTPLHRNTEDREIE